MLNELLAARGEPIVTNTTLQRIGRAAFCLDMRWTPDAYDRQDPLRVDDMRAVQVGRAQAGARPQEPDSPLEGLDEVFS